MTLLLVGLGDTGVLGRAFSSIIMESSLSDEEFTDDDRSSRKMFCEVLPVLFNRRCVLSKIGGIYRRDIPHILFRTFHSALLILNKSLEHSNISGNAVP